MTKKIGALWLKQKGNMQYMSGVIQDLRGDINIAVFRNDRKEKDNQPDYNIVLSERQEKVAGVADTTPPLASPQGTTTPPPATPPTTDPEVDVEKIPF